MANKNNNFGLSEIKAPTGGGFSDRIKPPEIKIEKKNDDFDISKAMEQIKSNASTKKSGLTVNVLGDDIFKSTNKSVLTTPGQIAEIDFDHQNIIQARALIKKEKFGEALQILDNILTKNKSHLEALYLSAYCFNKLDKYYNALEKLSPFKKLTIDAKLKESVIVLKDEIRSNITPYLLGRFIFGNKNDLINDLDHLIDIDSDYEFYYFLFASILMHQKMYTEAYGCIEDGLGKISSASQWLIHMKKKVQTILLEDYIIPITTQVKKKSYGKALKMLDNIDTRLKNCTDYKLYKKYITKLDSNSSFFSKKSPIDIPIDGSPIEIGIVQSYLVKENIILAHKQIDLFNDCLAILHQLGFNTLIDKAFEPLTVALNQCYDANKYVSNHPYIHYLIAWCRYQIFYLNFITQKFNGIESVIHELKSIHDNAKIAILDKSYKPSINLFNEILEMQKLINEVHEEQKKYQKEQKILNDAYTDFNEIMKSGSAISTIQIWNTIYSKLDNLKRRVKASEKEMHSPQSRKDCSALITHIDKNFDALNSMKSGLEEMEILKSHYTTYNSYVANLQSIKFKITSHYQLSGYISDFTSLSNSISRDFNKVISNEVKMQLAHLKGEVDSFVRQFENLR